MYLIQIFLPLRDNAGKRIARARFDSLSAELTTRFGGLTRYSQAPATGLWKKSDGAAQRDDIIVYEVMSSRLQRSWWRSTRLRLQREFRQQELLIRALPMSRL